MGLCHGGISSRAQMHFLEKTLHFSPIRAMQAAISLANSESELLTKHDLLSLIETDAASATRLLAPFWPARRMEYAWPV
jgi:hypothetical protein